MPSEDLPLRFQQDLQLLSRYRWNGTHYERTANAWLARMDERRRQIVRHPVPLKRLAAAAMRLRLPGIQQYPGGVRVVFNPARQVDAPRVGDRLTVDVEEFVGDIIVVS